MSVSKKKKSAKYCLWLSCSCLDEKHAGWLVSSGILCLAHWKLDGKVPWPREKDLLRHLCAIEQPRSFHAFWFACFNRESMQCPGDMHSYWLFLPAARLILLSDPCRCSLIYTCTQTPLGMNVGIRPHLHKWTCSNIDCNNRKLLLIPVLCFT